ncbi:MAG: hypothetical protein LBR23_00185 [Spirochaetaceae bacterium]|jgi:hypothetical protein|nr:hypothetical protein [Spirochaetaceae bacterium]
MTNFLNLINSAAFNALDGQTRASFRALAEEKDIPALGKAAGRIADFFGADGKFEHLMGKKTGTRDTLEQKLVLKFHKNLQLLVKKSWVEKYDEALKEQVLGRLEKFCALFSREDYVAAYKDFLEVLSDTVYLMFGQQAKKDDFAEYAMRIDPEFGLFWLYVRCLGVDTPDSCERCRIMILLGIVFLANY